MTDDPTTAPRESLVLAAGALRGAPALDVPASLPCEDPPVDAVVAALARVSAPRAWLGGGEVTLRRDLPALVQACPDVGLWTDGLALASRGVAAQLRAWGIRRVRVAWHSARADAHDWLVGRDGAGRRVARGIRAAVAAGLEVDVEVCITRPTSDLLPETVVAAARLGASGVHLRRVVARGPADAAFLALSPRLGLLQPLLEAAVRQGRREGLAVQVADLPRCALPAEADALLPVGWLELLSPTAALDRVAADLRGPAPAPGCATCPGAPTCAGAPADYVRWLGRTEIDDRASAPPADGLDVGDGLGPAGTPPPPRAGRAPATRVAFAVRQAERGALHGDPLAGVPGVHLPRVVTIAFPPATPSRALRQALGRVAQEGAPTLHLADRESLLHPDAVDLLRECVRLGFARVCVAGRIDGLAAASDRELIGLRGLTRVVALRYGPDAASHDAVAGPGSWDAAEATLARIGRLVRAETSVREVSGDGPLPADLLGALDLG